ncbi:armadillo-type protein [Favolaschia claudopus]|uniref:Armadillo-type protein n=1 Tax=Favolaschia claudopus TaxID=2862362 RepID=A0AAV9Z5D3_9AGAR
MLSLRLQEPSPSLLSYWSDNMSVGPNLPLHTLSKPAIRYLYQSQVRNYIKTNEKDPLSEEMMEVFESYLRSSMSEAGIIGSSPLFEHNGNGLSEFAHSIEHRFHQVARFDQDTKFLGGFGIFLVIPASPSAKHSLTVPSFTYQLCLSTDHQASMLHSVEERLRVLADNDLLSIMSSGLAVITNIHDFSARTAVFAAILKRASAEDSPPEIQNVTLDIFTSYVGSGPDFSRQLLDVIARAGYSDGTRTSIMKSLAVNPNLITDLLQNAACTYTMCVALENLAQTQAAVLIMLDLKVHSVLVKLLLDTTPASSEAQCAPILVLSQICAWSRGAEAVVFEGNMLRTTKKLLKWKSEDTFIMMCHCLEAIAQHESTYHSLLSDELFEMLFGLFIMRETTSAITQCAALRVLHQICVWCKGAEAVVFQSNILNTYTTKALFSSEDTSIAICHCLRTIAQHKSTYHAILSAEFIKPLLRETTSDISQCAALRVLYQICVWSEGAEAVVMEGNMLDIYITKALFGSEDTFVAACHWLRAVVQHKSTYHSILSADHIKLLFWHLSPPSSSPDLYEMTGPAGLRPCFS